MYIDTDIERSLTNDAYIIKKMCEVQILDPIITKNYMLVHTGIEYSLTNNTSDTRAHRTGKGNSMYIKIALQSFKLKHINSV